MNTVDTRLSHSGDQEQAGQGGGDMTAVFDVLVRYRKTFAVVVGGIVTSGLLYSLLASPVYRTDIMVQVEEPGGTAMPSRLIAGVSPIFDVKPAPTAEMELLRSRLVVGKAVEDLHLYIDATPRYLPLIGPAIAGFNKGLSTPGLFGWGGFAWGREAIDVQELDVPPELEDKKIMLTALGENRYRVEIPDEKPATGTVGAPLLVAGTHGNVKLLVNRIDGRAGSQFVLCRSSYAETVERLQEKLMIGERGKQSGMIGVALEGKSPSLTVAILNEIGNAYVQQNLQRKAAEAEKSLSFLEQQLPQLRQQVETAESRYNAMRNQRGTVDLSEESKLMLAQSVQIQTRLQELRQRRQELAARFMPNHPAIEMVDNQIAGLSGQLGGVTGKIQKLPDVEQNVLRLMRDVKVSTEMLQSLLNDVQQLKLMKASKVGTARMVDPADLPTEPVRPNRKLIAALSVLLGLFSGIMAVLARHVLEGGISDADEIERKTGMTVYATIPYSEQQAKSQLGNEADGLLARDQPDDPAVESLRSFRTALQFALGGSGNRVVVLAGPAPGVGKSFVCANFATVAATGRRVVLIDADLRRGGLHNRFDVKRSPGLTDLLMGAPLDRVVHRQVAPGLDFIPTGTEPPHAADVLLSPGMDSLLAELRSRYDLILIDTPPVLAASDAGILAGKAGAVFMVARAETTTIGELVASQRALEQAGAQVKGVLFNGLKVEGRWYRSHYAFGKYRYLSEYGKYGAESKRA